MKRIIFCACFLILVFGFFSLSYGATINITDLIDNFQKSTDLQRSQMLKDTLGKEISGTGTVSNVGEYDFFDIVNDVKGLYYQVSTEQQKTKNNVAYQVIFLFKDPDKVKDIDKGQLFQRDGKIIRIEDERLQISIWLFCDELASQDKALLKGN